MTAFNFNPWAGRLFTWILLAALLPSLAGCFGAAAVGLGTTMMFAVDRRATETLLTDEGIEVRSSNRLSEKFGDRGHFNVTSFNRSVLLTGEVPDADAKAEAEKLVSGVPNVKAAINELKIAGVSSLPARSNDAYVTSKVKARFLESSQFSANHIKVVTEAGTVYLLGLVTKREADTAAEVARNTDGAMLVVRLFEFLDEEEAKRIDDLASVSAAKKKP